MRASRKASFCPCVLLVGNLIVNLVSITATQAASGKVLRQQFPEGRHAVMPTEKMAIHMGTIDRLNAGTCDAAAVGSSVELLLLLVLVVIVINALLE